MNNVEIKMARNDWQKQMLLQKANLLLNKVERDFTLNETCFVTFLPENPGLDWWKTSSCVGNFQLFQYYYAIEKLGLHYFRITIRVHTDEHWAEKIILQSVVLKSDTASVRQSWREIA